MLLIPFKLNLNKHKKVLTEKARVKYHIQTN